MTTIRITSRQAAGRSPSGTGRDIALVRLATFAREEALLAAGARLIAGIDEVGRGPLAGPVVAAAVILDPRRVPKGLADSKLLPKAAREALYGDILKHATVGVACVSAREIDTINIRQASLLAMRRACAALAHRPDRVLVDGNDCPSFAGPGGLLPAEAIVGGDALVASIAAASIVAKVTRDRLMVRLAAHHPHYGFEAHMGYATPQHRTALDAYGPCPFHRYSFAPIKGRHAR